MIPSSNILRFVREALTASLAYAALVQETLGKIPWRVSAELFTKLPITSKSTFSQKLPVESLLLDGERGAVAYASSGSSGTPSFWFRDERTLKDGTDLHQYIFEHVYGIRPGEPTLVLVTFSMGLWVAGPLTADSCRALRERGFAVTIATPGIDREEGLSALKRLAPLFKHVVIAGYPPSVLDLLRQAFRDPADVPLSTFILTAGDKFSEEWRDEALGLIRQPERYSRIIGVYGSADAGAMAFETPLTIALRRAARADTSLAERLFPDSARQGGLYQFLPDLIYIEQHDGELLITKRMPIPLVRYNIHDKGVVVAPPELAALAVTASTHVGAYHLPMVSVTGRTDVAVTLYALNIYPDQISAGIPGEFSTGSYLASTEQQEGAHSERLIIELELQEGSVPAPELESEVIRRMTETLRAMNTEYKKLHEQLGEAAVPKVRLYAKGTLPAKVAAGSPAKALLQVTGKKPRVILPS